MKRDRKPTSHLSPRHRSPTALAIAAISAFPLLSALTNTARAVDDVYINPNGTLWSTSANWNDGFLPGTGDRAFVSALGITLNVDYANFPLLFLVLDAGNNVGNSTTLFQTIAADNMLSQNEWIGDSGTKPTTYLQLAANNTDTGDLSIAHTTNTAVGQYTLQGGNLTVLGSEYVGNAGAGGFTQTGGTHTIGTPATNENLFLGYNILSSGTTFLNGSTAQLTVNGSAYIGGSTTASRGFGTLTIQSGTMTVTGTLKVWNSTGNVSLVGGSLNVGALDTSGTPSHFNWGGGNLSIASGLSISSTGPLGNSISIVSSESLVVGASEIIGDNSAGMLVQAGGANTVNATLYVGDQAGSTGIYTITNAAATLTVNGSEHVGYAATGTSIGGTVTQYGGTFNQTTGTHTVTGSLFLGSNSGGTGSFTLSGGTLAVGTTNQGLSSEYIGDSGLGNFTQSGGTHTIGTPAVIQALYIGANTPGIGTYTLNNNSAAATLTINGSEVVGFDATGTSSGGNITRYGGAFTQTAGTHTVTGTMILGENAGATGSFALSGGSLVVGTTGGAENSLEYIGEFGTGSFTQSGGSHTVGTPAAIQDLYLGLAGTGIGTYTLNNNSAASTLTINGNEYIGFFATGTSSGGNVTRYGGTFNQSAGQHTVTEALILGQYSGATGSFALSGGTLAVGTTGATGNSNEYIGVSGSANFTQSGGTHTVGTPAVNQNLYLAYNASSNGTYTMNDPAATLTVNGNAYVGGSNTTAGGLGVLNISAGNATVTQTLTVRIAIGTGMNLSGGGLTVGSIQGSFLTYAVSWTGGTLTLTGAGIGTTNFQQGLTLGSNIGNNCTLNLQGGNLAVDTFPSGQSENIGVYGVGTVTQSGGTNTVGNQADPPGNPGQNLRIGLQSSSIGSYTMNNVAATLTAFGSETIGEGATGTSSGGIITQYGGTFNQIAGINTLSDELIVAEGQGSTGLYKLSGGSLTVGALEYIGWSGTGNFIQTGGTHTIGTPAAPGYLSVGYGTSGIGNYTMTNAATLSVNGYEYIGDAATGTTNAAGNITTYGGSFNQIAGTHTVTGNLIVGHNSASTGSFTLAGGTLTIGANANEIIGLSGIGTFIQTGGSHTIGIPTVFQTLYVGGNAAAIGSYTLNNNTGPATLTVNGDEIVGTSATGTTSAGIVTQYGGTFNQSAGNHTVTGTLTLAFLAGSTGSFTLSGGTLTLVTAGVLPISDTSEFVGYSGVGAFTQSGGTHTIGTPARNQSLFVGLYTPGIGTYTMNNPAATLTVNGDAGFGGSNFAAGGVGVLNLSAGSATITGTLIIWNTPGSAANLMGGTLHVANANNMQSFTQSPGNSLYVTGNFTNSGNASFAGSQNWSPTSSFTNTAGSASFQSDAKLYALSITAGTVDITTSKLVIEPANKSATLAALQANIANHSLIASGIPPNFALALLDNALLNKLTFGGLPVDSNSLLLSQELLGDANIDGHVDLSDLSTILNNFGTTTPAWTSGNFDHASTIDLTDLAAVLNNFGLTYANSSIATGTLAIPTPEPSSLCLLTFTLSTLLRRKRSMKRSTEKAIAYP